MLTRFKKGLKYGFYGFWGLMILALILFSNRAFDKTKAIVAVVEPERVAVSYARAVRLQTIHVIPGQEIKAGDTLIKVERPDLVLDLETVAIELTGALTRKDKKIKERAGRINLVRRKYATERMKLGQEIKTIKLQVEKDIQQIKQLESLQSLPQGVEGGDFSLANVKIRILEEEMANLKLLQNLEIQLLDNQFRIEDELIDLELIRLEGELELLKEEQRKLIQIAQIDGTIGNVYSHAGELISPYTTILSIYESHPTVIKAFMNEENHLPVQAGDTVQVQSSNRRYSITGEVVEIGSRIVSYPNRLLVRQDLPVWGQELFVRIPKENKFLNGEKVLVLLPNGNQ